MIYDLDRVDVPSMEREAYARGDLQLASILAKEILDALKV